MIVIGTRTTVGVISVRLWPAVGRSATTMSAIGTRTTAALTNALRPKHLRNHRLGCQYLRLMTLEMLRPMMQPA